MDAAGWHASNLETEGASIVEALKDAEAGAEALDKQVSEAESSLATQLRILRERNERLAEVEEAVSAQRDSVAAAEAVLQQMRAVISDFEDRVALHAQREALRSKLATKTEVIAKLEKKFAVRWQQLEEHHTESVAIAGVSRQAVLEASTFTAAACAFRGSAEVTVQPLKTIDELVAHSAERETHARAVVEHIVQDQHPANVEADETLCAIESSASEALALVQELKMEQRRAFTKAHKFEMANLKREKARVDSIAKEVAFHDRRGTLNKRSTKKSGEESRLNEKIVDLHHDISALQGEFEQARNELVELERVAMVTYDQLLFNRRQFGQKKGTEHAKLADLKNFKKELTLEQQTWCDTLDQLRNHVRASQQALNEQQDI